MPYNTTGEVHFAGIANENDLVKQFNINSPECFNDAYPGKILEFRKEGGSTLVPDIGIYTNGERLDGISVKLHRKGTFDHINTSKVEDYTECSELQDLLKKMRNDHYGDSQAIPKVRETINTKICETFGEMMSDNIRKLLKTIHLRSPRWFVVKENNRISIFEHSEFSEFVHFPEDTEITYFLRSTSRAKTSKQIWRIKHGIEINTNLRLRCVTNNGINALLGLSKSNKNSIITLKIQQDCVNHLLLQVRRSLIETS